MSDQEWVLDGANVHVSMIAFDDGTEKQRMLDGVLVETIHPNLTATDNLGSAKFLNTNKMLGFVGVAQKAPFDLPDEAALQMLRDPNPNGKPSSDVLRPICNAMDITRRNRNVWNIDFGLDRSEADSSLFEKPFAHVVNIVKPLRINHREPRQVKYWWLFARPCPDMRKGLEGLPRFLTTPRVSKHRIFAWITPEILCDSAVVVFARDDDYFFGILHSRIHELWALAQGTQLREKESGFRYTPTTCFETFPFPHPTPEQTAAIATAAKNLDTLRTRWLNPPEWTRPETLTFPGSSTGPWSRYLQEIEPTTGLGTVHYPRLAPRDPECAAKLAKRTLTALYNERPSWLAHAHAELDTIVSAAYGFPPDLPDQEILSRLLAMNQQRA